jgi:heparanase
MHMLEIYWISGSCDKSNAGVSLMEHAPEWTARVPFLVARAQPIWNSRMLRVPRHIGTSPCRYAAYAGLFASALSVATAEVPSVAPSSMPRIGTVDERFQSYNIEMVEITGGRFWKPYRAKSEAGPSTPRDGPDTPEHKDAHLYQYRPPIDLTSARLRTLAAALGPAYLRVSGTWANTTYFADSDQPPSLPPPGFTGILSRLRWREVVRFSQGVNAEIVTSFAASNRDAAGAWVPGQAQRLLVYTSSIGGRIAAAEFVNEPDIAGVGGAPAGYDLAAYGRDFRLFHSLMKSTTPDTMTLGPGVAGEGPSASDLLAASGSAVDAISYHYYNTLSERCAGTTAPEIAMSEDWLSGTDQALSFFAALRDRLEPGKPIWLTETADAACGGNPWAVTFVDTFRYLDQLGRLARAGVQVVIHNTLAASDYGLLDEATLQPRPKYWGALLWRRLMGATVLDPGTPVQANLHVYAHCQRAVPGGVSLLVINTGKAPHSLRLSTASVRYTLDAAGLSDSTIRLNGNALMLNDRNELPTLAGAPTIAKTVIFEPATITFLAVPSAANGACSAVVKP